MASTDSDQAALIEAFHTAAFGTGDWVEALDALARATGSRGGELIGLGSRHSVPFNWASGMDPEWPEAFRTAGGGDPSTNPYVRAGSAAAELEVLSSAQFVTREERRRDPFLNEHCVG